MACSVGVSNGGANRLMSLSPTNPSSVCRAFLFVRLLPWKRNAPNDFPTVDRERRSFFRHSGRRVDVASFQGTCEIVPLAIASGGFDPRDVPPTRLSIQQGTCLVPKSMDFINFHGGNRDNCDGSKEVLSASSSPRTSHFLFPCLFFASLPHYRVICRQMAVTVARRGLNALRDP